jgi:hypothetical protein
VGLAIMAYRLYSLIAYIAGSDDEWWRQGVFNQLFAGEPVEEIKYSLIS